MKPKLLLSALFALVFTVVHSQNSQVLYFLNLPQNHLLNPALKPTNKVYVGLPALTGINVNVTNNFFNFSDLLPEGMDISESTIPFLNPDFDRDKFLGSLKDINYFEPKVDIQLFGLGFTAGRDLYVFLDITDRVNLNMAAPRDLFRLAFLGNQEFAGQTFDLSSTQFDFNYYHEIGAGASKNITPKLRLGAKARLLLGVTSGSLNAADVRLRINNDYTNTLDVNGTFDFSAPVIFYTGDDNDIDSVKFDEDRFNTSAGIRKFLSNTGNAGFGFDIGAEYSITDKILISGALTDFGFIKWKTDVVNIETNKSIELQGLDIYDIYEGNATLEDMVGGAVDSIISSLNIKADPIPFTTKLSPALVIGGRYNLNDLISFGVLSYSRFAEQQVRQAVTLSANMNLRSSLSAALAYTVCNDSYDNLGLGLGFRASVFQFYFLLDRIPLSWKKTVQNDISLTLPANWNTIHTRFGLNLVFGNRMKRPDRKDDIL